MCLVCLGPRKEGLLDAPELLERWEALLGACLAGYGDCVRTTDYEVTFATDGPAGGHIRVTQGGNVTLDRLFAAEVEDDYQKWSEDPRYGAWMTRPEYRNFIGNTMIEKKDD